jgi:hypothetical protein
VKRVEMIPYPVGRIFNETWGPSDICHRCEDQGLVVVGTDHWGDDMAPCPDCRKGFCVEFGYGRAPSKHGPVFVQSDWPHWGPQGYWAKQGALIGMLPVTKHSEPLMRVENERRIKVLGQAMSGGGFTRALLEELYGDDHEGLAEHNRLAGVRELPRF